MLQQSLYKHTLLGYYARRSHRRLDTRLDTKSFAYSDPTVLHSIPTFRTESFSPLLVYSKLIFRRAVAARLHLAVVSTQPAIPDSFVVKLIAQQLQMLTFAQRCEGQSLHTTTQKHSLNSDFIIEESLQTSPRRIQAEAD